MIDNNNANENPMVYMHWKKTCYKVNSNNMPYMIPRNRQESQVT
jgi:hypothetical protein